MSQLTATLLGTVSSTSGNILTDGILPGSFGADGGHVQSITADGTTYTYNPAAGGSIAVSGGADHGSFDTTTNTETVTLNSGGVLTMDMDNGTYGYTAPANVTSGFSDTVPFVLIDNDGDTAGNNLKVVVTTQDHAPIVRDDHVITNAPAVSGPDSIVIPDWALLFNDNDPDLQAITISAVSGAVDGSVAHASGNVTFTEESNGATDGGSFTYTGSSNGLTDTGVVTVDRGQINNSTLNGTGLSDILIGRDGNGTTINGYEGNDVLIGGNQGDILNGGTGDDSMRGGAGDDTYVVDSTNDQVVENANEGTDTIQASITYSLAAIANVENLTLTGNANLNGTGNSLNNVITGNSGDNTLDGGAGTDTLVGGAGNDTYIVDSTTDTITEGNNAGTDTVLSSVTFSLAAIANVENLTLTGAGNINATGNSLNNILIGNTGDNLITGGTGKDNMTGGAGHDTFAFNATNESGNTSGTADVITDFVHGQDFIDLTAIDANTSSGGNQAFTFNGATPTAHGVWVTESGGNTLISMDTNGSTGSVEMMIVLTGINKGLTAADFHL
jgi:Ca2+-binding RTX toxin-like protein